MSGRAPGRGARPPPRAEGRAAGLAGRTSLSRRFLRVAPHDRARVLPAGGWGGEGSTSVLGLQDNRHQRAACQRPARAVPAQQLAALPQPQPQPARPAAHVAPHAGGNLGFGRIVVHK